jgi:maleate isomerase
MAAHLTQAASLFPHGLHFDAAGYGCTSASAEIGAERIADLIHAGVDVDAVTNPLSALVAACKALNIRRLGFVSPYVAEVSDKLRRALDDAGIATPAFGSFEEEVEARVVRIDGPSVQAAARTVAARAPVDGIFLSCTNLRTLDVIAPLQDALGMPVMSSNLVLAWDMLRRAGHPAGDATPSELI